MILNLINISTSPPSSSLTINDNESLGAHVVDVLTPNAISGNKINLYVGGNAAGTLISNTSGHTLTTNVGNGYIYAPYVPLTMKSFSGRIYLDGGSNTYIYENNPHPPTSIKGTCWQRDSES